MVSRNSSIAICTLLECQIGGNCRGNQDTARNPRHMSHAVHAFDHFMELRCIIHPWKSFIGDGEV